MDASAAAVFFGCPILRAAEEAQGEINWLCPEFQKPRCAPEEQETLALPEPAKPGAGGAGWPAGGGLSRPPRWRQIAAGGRAESESPAHRIGFTEWRRHLARS